MREAEPHIPTRRVVYTNRPNIPTAFHALSGDFPSNTPPSRSALTVHRRGRFRWSALHRTCGRRRVLQRLVSRAGYERGNGGTTGECTGAGPAAVFWGTMIPVDAFRAASFVCIVLVVKLAGWPLQFTSKFNGGLALQTAGMLGVCCAIPAGVGDFSACVV